MADFAVVGSRKVYRCVVVECKNVGEVVSSDFCEDYFDVEVDRGHRCYVHSLCVVGPECSNCVRDGLVGGGFVSSEVFHFQSRGQIEEFGGACGEWSEGYDVACGH